MFALPFHWILEILEMLTIIYFCSYLNLIWCYMQYVKLVQCLAH